MKHFLKLTSVLLALILLTGCWDQNIYERIGFILNIGFDKGTGNNFIFTISIPIISSDGTSGNSSSGSEGSDMSKIDVYSTETNLIREAREIIRRSSPKQLEGGKIQNALFSSDFAKENGITEYLELYERDIQSTSQAWVVIVDGNANELIKKASQFKGKPRLGMYLNELLERNSKSGYCPKMTIIKYNIENVIPGLSPIVPLIKLNNNSVEVEGTALMSLDKMTGQLDTHETACLFMSMGKAKLSEIVFDMPEEIKTKKIKAVVSVSKVKTKSKIHIDGNVPSIDFSIKLNAILDEYTWGDITNNEYKSKIETALSTHIMNCLNTVFKKLQNAKCDALGIGDKIRAYHYNYWKSIGELNGWKKIFPNMTANFSITADILRSGEIE